MKPYVFYMLGCILLQGCTMAIPPGIHPVANFDINKYMGHWYEVARLDNRFQRGLERVTATYSLRQNGSVRVVNTGWHSKNKQQKTIVGKAKFVSDKRVGHLKVSFGGPFYGSYVVCYLEADYSVAIVCGSSRKYCWILARSPILSAADMAKYQQIVRELGFPIADFLYTANVVPATG